VDPASTGLLAVRGVKGRPWIERSDPETGLPGSPATYVNLAALREMGLRWDPAGHRWHGTTTADRVRGLREGLGLEVRVFGQLEPPVG
jgi:hypothetical protein